MPTSTVMGKVPVVESRAIGATAVTCDDETNVVASAAPLKSTLAPLVKPDPLTLSVVSAAYCVRRDGESAVNRTDESTPTTVKLMAFDWTPRSDTVMGKLPFCESCAVVSVVLNDVADNSCDASG